MHAAARDGGDVEFGAFLRHRGQDALRLAYLLTGDQDAARALAVGSLGELGARWQSLVREHGDPEVAARVLAANQFLRVPDSGPPPEQPAGSGELPPDGVVAGWGELCARPPTDRADLVLQHWAELDADALDRALAPRRRSFLTAIRAQAPGAWVRAVVERALTAPASGDHALIDASPRPHAPDRSGRLTGWFLQDVFRFAERSAPVLDADFLTDVRAYAEARRQQVRHRNRFVTAVAAALVTVAGAAGALVPETQPPPRAADATDQVSPLTWSAAWPNSQVTRFSAELADGRSYRPLRFVSMRTALAVTAAGAGASQLVLVDLVDRTARVLGALDEPVEETATASDGFNVGWIAARRGSAELWVADVSSGSPRLVATVPDASPRERSLTLGMGSGRLYLVRAWGGENRTVEIHSARLTGGQLRYDLTLAGYVPVGWPWFSTVATSARQNVRVRNVLTGADRSGRLPRESALGVCDGAWCVGTLRRGGPRLGSEVLIGRLDGSHPTVATLSHPEHGPPPVLARRFVLTRGPGEVTYLHDLREKRPVRIAGTVRQVLPSGQLLGWSVSSRGGNRWRLANLAFLP